MLTSTMQCSTTLGLFDLMPSTYNIKFTIWKYWSFGWNIREVHPFFRIGSMRLFDLTPGTYNITFMIWKGWNLLHRFGSFQGRKEWRLQSFWFSTYNITFTIFTNVETFYMKFTKIEKHGIPSINIYGLLSDGVPYITKIWLRIIR